MQKFGWALPQLSYSITQMRGGGHHNVVTRTRLGAGRPREIVIRSRNYLKISLLLQNVQTGCGTQPTSCSMGAEDSFTAPEQPEPKTIQPDPSSLKLNNRWPYTSTLKHTFVACTETTLPSCVTTLEVLRTETHMSYFYLLNTFAV
jgi:hypothetical protein